MHAHEIHKRGELGGDGRAVHQRIRDGRVVAECAADCTIKADGDQVVGIQPPGIADHLGRPGFDLVLIKVSVVPVELIFNVPGQDGGVGRAERVDHGTDVVGVGEIVGR